MSAAYPDRFRPVDRLRILLILPQLLQLRRGSAGGMNHIEGFEATIHGALGQPILLGGAPRGLAIVNGTIAAAIGLGLQQWLAGLMVWALAPSIAVFAARRDPDLDRKSTSLNSSH